MEDNVFHFQVLSDETVITSIDTGSEYYESLLEKLQKSPILKERDCFEVIDMQWVLESGILYELKRLS